MPQILNGDLFANVHTGIIVHQVNCQNAMGAGFAKSFYNHYPQIKREYHALASAHTPEKLLGAVQSVELTSSLSGVNLFTQLNYGNSRYTHKVYTDQPLLTKLLIENDRNSTEQVYAPYKIGCGLAGGNWDKLYHDLETANCNIIFYKI